MADTTATKKGTGAVKTTKPKVMTVAISDEKALYLSYMPFLANGGIFVPTDASYTVGDPVFLILKLPDSEQHAIPGTVGWITPRFCSPLFVFRISCCQQRSALDDST